jgi:hypothetical protein
MCKRGGAVSVTRMGLPPSIDRVVSGVAVIGLCADPAPTIIEAHEDCLQRAGGAAMHTKGA